ncbi:putative LPS ABC transporter, permease protein LptG [Leptospira fainei serovar Hurstbridge str. BUT 6]|uniref:LPS ABC transporter, permease protein LptG n=1 Tax=Leptospira fainei serovar Hurstbridge str. BUT 6 TaxID=1193011 RepID=S3VB90_9LEPT|nr:LptF/LptG family permease [Leptospira fainei]EPG73740.1 putative LPS ABC transporter, permease protein LptG [Leptospira fainei serovar Hurstbridge str. BUT 6]
MELKIPRLQPRELLFKLKEEFFPPRILDRYVFSEFFKTFGGTCIMITALIFLNMVNTNLKDFSGTKAPKFHIWLYLAYSLPEIIASYSINMSVLFAVSFTIGQFSANKEIVAMMSAGVSFHRIVAPIVAFGFLLWFIVFLGTQFIVRPMNKLAKEEQKMITEGTGTLTNMVYQFHFKGKEGFYYIYFYDPVKDEIKGGFNYVKLTREQAPEYVLSSLKAKYNPQADIWKLTEVEETRFDDDLKVKSFERFPEKEYYLPEKPEYFKVPKGSVKEMNIFELSEEKDNRVRKGIGYGDVNIEEHSLFASPFLAVIVTLVGCVAGFFTKRVAGVASLGVTLVVILVYFVMSSAFTSVGENGVIPAWFAVWVTPAIFLGVLYGIYRRMRI